MNPSAQKLSVNLGDTSFTLREYVNGDLNVDRWEEKVREALKKEGLNEEEIEEFMNCNCLFLSPEMQDPQSGLSDGPA